MSLVACLLMLAVLYTVVKTPLSRSRKSSSKVAKKQQPDCPQQPPIARKTTISFQELAQSMVLSSFTDVLAHLSIFTPTVMPNVVEPTRKELLATRNLLDVFSPVYPDTSSSSRSSSSAADKHQKNELDLWFSIRHFLDLGYEQVGDFQDLHNAHVQYTDAQLTQRRSKVLAWRKQFAAFCKSHQVEAFLAAPTEKGGVMHQQESRLFWKYVDDAARPSGSAPATASLQLLAFHQLERVKKYLNQSMIEAASVLNVTAYKRFHGHYHSLRKELRTLTNEFDQFGEHIVPDTSKYTRSTIATMKDARKLLGDMNDDFTAYSIYFKNNMYPEEQERLSKEIDERWDEFKKWMVDRKFEDVIDYLHRYMNCSLAVQPGKLARATIFE